MLTYKTYTYEACKKKFLNSHFSLREKKIFSPYAPGNFYLGSLTKPNLAVYKVKIGLDTR